VIVTPVPATVNVPLREDVPVFAATLYATEPLAEPLPPDVIVIQLAPLVAVHEQPVGTVTVIDPVPPLPSNEAEVGVTP
jgi:hypothetical protein